ncbi:MAG: response regulator [Calditrichaceae bacterium]|nr:response regulator [Calditrichaceae bacterium]
MINVIYEEKDLLWIGTEKGLNILNKKTGSVEYYNYNPYDDRSISSNSVLAICRDKKNLMWIGTWAGGLNLFNEESKTFTRYKYNEHDETSLGSNNIFDIMCDSDGDLWVATMGGGLNFYNYKTQNFKRYGTDFQEENTISDNWVECLLESSSGDIWISTTTAVDIFDKHNQRFTSFKHDTSDPSSINYNGAIFLYEDSNKNIWAGTESGLNLFNREDSTFSSYQESDGLPNNTIKGICEDNKGNLWLSTNYGLSKFINGINHPKHPKFKNYNISDGLQGNEFNNRCVCKGHDGILYFGGNNGFNAFKPEDIAQDTESPEVVLTNFLIFNKPVEIGREDSPLQKHISLCEELRLNYNHSVFCIEYAALNFLKPDKNRYAFMLEGFEDDWNYVGNQRLATYTNLDAGEYIFRVKAIGHDDIWHEQDKSIRIIIIPPWWKTWWAYLLYFVLGISFLYSIWRFQLNRAKIKHELILEQQHAEKLEELNRMKSRFFSNITHEFRTPLTLIMGPVKQFLTDGVQSNFSDKCKMILRNSEKLYHLINQLLELNKLEAGFIKLEARETNIIPIIEKIILSFSSLMDSEKIKFNFSVIREPDQINTPLNIYIDGDKFEKIINNLLSNAIKFTPEEGNIEIILKDFIVGHKGQPAKDREKEYIEIIVKDSGRGIPEGDLNRIFDRFYQVDNSRYSGYVGTGIGLSLVKELVELHRGTIKVESATGKGTSFILHLLKGYEHFESSEIMRDLKNTEESRSRIIPDNYINNDENQSAVLKKITNIKNSSRILIIEDNPDLLKYLSDCLCKKYQIIKAKNGEEGVGKALRYIPDLIVSDLIMPNMDGLTFCSTIKKDERTSHIPVIFLTARASGESRIKGLQTGADDYICKPFEINELEARIQNLIDQRQQLKEKFKRKAGLKPHEIVTSSLDKKFLEKGLLIIEKNISDSNFSVEKFAKEMALSRVQLYRKIRALTGQTASEFIRTVRINRAAQLLKQKYDNIGQIAFFVGFNNPSYFSKCFYKQFGMYPSNYSE